MHAVALSSPVVYCQHLQYPEYYYLDQLLSKLDLSFSFAPMTRRAIQSITFRPSASGKQGTRGIVFKGFEEGL